MSVSLHEGATAIMPAQAPDLELNQKVMVVQSKREKVAVGPERQLGALVCEVSRIEGTVSSLPHIDEQGRIMNFVHVDQGEREPTYVVPVDPVTVVDTIGQLSVQRELHFAIYPLESYEQ